MKIQSRFRDYYDYVAHQYGGGDPRVLYLRDRIVPQIFYGGNIYESGIDVKVEGLARTLYATNSSRYSVDIGYEWLVVCGKAYLVVGYKDSFYHQAKDYHVIDKVTDKVLLEELTCGRWGSTDKTFEDFCGLRSEIFNDISRSIKHPVYTITRWDNHSAHIKSRIPILQDLGFSSIVKPETLYQELAYYISNVMVESADIKPPTQVSNKDRIQQYGFDLKQSFRHRK